MRSLNRSLNRPLAARATDEEHRAATPLELFFDLCFVVAVAQASSSLHHALAEAHFREALLGYTFVFFAIWWAWMNFTWFASAYDNDDVGYRLVVFVEIAGVLILAAGVPRAFDDHEWAIVTLGYAVMRIALVSQWVRAAICDPPRRTTGFRYAFGVGTCMLGWGALLLLPDGWVLAGWAVMVPAELLVPVWAERAEPTTWHPHHIAERFGLFTLIVLGESVLAATVAVQSAFDAGDELPALLEIALGGLLIVSSLWWIYFAQPAEDVVDRARSAFESGRSRVSFGWGYGHLPVFAGAAAVGAGLAVATDEAVGHADLSTRGAALAVAIPVAVYMLSDWAVLGRHKDRTRVGVLSSPSAAVLVLVVAAVTGSVLAIGLVLALTVAVFVMAEGADSTDAIAEPADPGDNKASNTGNTSDDNDASDADELAASTEVTDPTT
jgi:low temperature requirement protein LtrA